MTMTRLIQANWNQHQGAGRHDQVKFTIQRDGTITDVERREAERLQFLDLASQRAVIATDASAAAAAAVHRDELTVHLDFEYKR